MSALVIRTTSQDGTPLCGCGCGGRIGKRARFKPGHDAKLKSKLARAHQTGQAVQIDEDAPAPAADVARQLGWSHLITARRSVEAAESALLDEVARLDPTQTASVGRWARNGMRLVAVLDDEIKMVTQDGAIVSVPKEETT